MEKYIVVKCSRANRIEIGDVFDVVKPFDNDTIHLYNVDGSDMDNPWMGTMTDKNELFIEGLSFRAELEPLTLDKERELEMEKIKGELVRVKEHDSCEALIDGEVVDCYFYANDLNCDYFECSAGTCYVTKEEAKGYEEGND